MLVDSHCHLNYLDDCDERLRSARARGVGAFLCIGVNRDTRDAVVDIARRHADVWMTHGVHPDSVTEDVDLEWVASASRLERVVGVGETGLDYYRLEAADDASRANQQAAFAAHLALGAERGMPVVVHSRAAEADTLRLIDGHRDSVGVLHCFTESWQLAKGALDLGWYVSISGIVTFRNAEAVRDVARRVPLDRLLIETDCPWLAPVPHRGRKNEPGFVADTAAFLAELRGVDTEELAAATTTNFLRLFSGVAISGS